MSLSIENLNYNKNQSIFHQYSWHETHLTLKTLQYLSINVNITKQWKFTVYKYIYKPRNGCVCEGGCMWNSQIHICKTAVTWLEYCRYGVKLYPIKQSINKLQKLWILWVCLTAWEMTFIHSDMHFHAHSIHQRKY